MSKRIGTRQRPCAPLAIRRARWSLATATAAPGVTPWRRAGWRLTGGRYDLCVCERERESVREPPPPHSRSWEQGSPRRAAHRARMCRALARGLSRPAHHCDHLMPPTASNGCHSPPSKPLPAHHILGRATPQRAHGASCHTTIAPPHAPPITKRLHIVALRISSALPAQLSRTATQAHPSSPAHGHPAVDAQLMTARRCPTRLSSRLACLAAPFAPHRTTA